MTNLPAPSQRAGSEPLVLAADLPEVVRLYGLRMWVEQSDIHVKHALGWSPYQVRSDQAIGRDFQLVWCAFSFCWYHASHSNSSTAQEALKPSEPEASTPNVPAHAVGTGKKISREPAARAQLSWPAALQVVRGWLEPWIMFRRSWSGWSPLPPPPALQFLLGWLERGHAIPLYSSA